MMYLVSLFLSLAAHASARGGDGDRLTTNCRQTFHLFALSSPSVFWIGEDVSGECGYSHILAISMEAHEPYLARAEVAEYGNWEWMKQSVEHLVLVEGVALDSTSLGWRADLGRLGHIHIMQPGYNSALADSVTRLIDHANLPAIWNAKRETIRIQTPRFEGVKANLLFAYSRGLYVNYRLANVVFFPDSDVRISGYLIAFTHQPRLAVGMDTMHGFLIFRIDEGED